MLDVQRRARRKLVLVCGAAAWALIAHAAYADDAASVSELVGKFEERRRLEEAAAEAVGRIERLVAGSWSKGRVGEANANLIGSMLITKIYLSAMSRADTSERVFGYVNSGSRTKLTPCISGPVGPALIGPTVNFPVLLYLP